MRESLMNLTDYTKHICVCSFISIILIILFIISPLNNFIKTSMFMKLIVLILLGYTFYLNLLQIDHLKKSSGNVEHSMIKNQLNINIICSYVFSLFLGLLLFFVIKSFF